MASQPWIAVSRDLAISPLVALGAEQLGVHRAEVAGALVSLWGRLANADRNGLLRGLPDALIEAWAEWEGTPKAFAEFVKRYHLDKTGHVKDWSEWNSPEARQRVQVAQRVQRHRDTHRSNGDVTHAVTVPVTQVGNADVTPERYPNKQTNKQTERERETAPSSWQAEKDQQRRDAPVIEDIRSLIASESKGGGPPQLPSDFYLGLTEAQRDVWKRHGGAAGIWNT